MTTTAHAHTGPASSPVDAASAQRLGIVSARTSRRVAADVFTGGRALGGEPLSHLLPELGATVIEPVVEAAQSSVLDSALHRLSLSLVSPVADEEPGLISRAEWIGVTDRWVVYLLSSDADLSLLERRLDDLGLLFRLIDPGVAS